MKPRTITITVFLALPDGPPVPVTYSVPRKEPTTDAHRLPER